MSERGLFSKILWEFPLTSGVCIVLVISFFVLHLFVSQNVQSSYFYSYPGNFNALNWLLSTFAHASVGHLFWNIFFLFLLGRAVEERVGIGKWLLFYSMAGLVSGFGDSLMRGILSVGPKSPTIGASGAICGIASVAALLSPYSLKFNNKKIPFPVFLIAWIMLYSDFTNMFSRDNVAHFAHLGGFFSVFLTAYFLSPEDKEKLKIGFYLNLVFFALTLVLLYLIRNR